MKHYLKFIIPVVICVIVIGVTFYMIFDIRNKVEDTYYNTNDISDDNIMIEDTNTALEETVNNANNNDNDNEDEDLNVVQDSEEGTTDKKEQAINLVKLEWGEDETVSFRCDSITTDGKYIVAVIDKSSATVKNYFKVDLSIKSIEIYY